MFAPRLDYPRQEHSESTLGGAQSALSCARNHHQPDGGPRVSGWKYFTLTWPRQSSGRPLFGLEALKAQRVCLFGRLALRASGRVRRRLMRCDRRRKVICTHTRRHWKATTGRVVWERMPSSSDHVLATGLHASSVAPKEWVRQGMIVAALWRERERQEGELA